MRERKIEEKILNDCKTISMIVKAEIFFVTSCNSLIELHWRPPRRINSISLLNFY